MRHRLIALLCSAFLASCASLPPTQEMSDARQALQTAEEIGARQILEARMQRVESLLRRAEQRLSVREYGLARGDALAARQNASRIRAIVWSIKQAQEAMASLTADDPRRPEVKRLIDTAITAARDGEDEHAIELSRRAMAMASGQERP